MVRARTWNLIDLTGEHQATLARWVRGRTTPQRLVLRSRIVLLAATGLAQARVAKRLGTSRQTVRLWCRRFTHGGPAALSVRKLARKLGVSPSAVHRAVAVARRRERQFRNGE
jgi:transposase